MFVLDNKMSNQNVFYDYAQKLLKSCVDTYVDWKIDRELNHSHSCFRDGGADNECTFCREENYRQQELVARRQWMEEVNRRVN